MPRLKLSKKYIAKLVKDAAKFRFDVREYYYDSVQNGLAVTAEHSGKVFYCIVYKDGNGAKKTFRLGACTELDLDEAREQARLALEKLEAEGKSEPKPIVKLGVPKYALSNSPVVKLKTVKDVFEKYKQKVPHSFDGSDIRDLPLSQIRRIRNHRSYVNIIANNFEWLMSTQVSQLRGYMLIEWGNDRVSKGLLLPSSANRDISAFRGMMHWAKKLGLISSYTFNEMGAITEDAKKNLNRRCLNSDEFARLIEALNGREKTIREKHDRYIASYTAKHRIDADIPVNTSAYPPFGEGYVDYVYPMVMLSLYTGCRKGGAIGLKWKDVDFEQRVVIFQAEMAKSKNNVISPMNDALYDILMKWKKQKRITDSPEDLDKFVLTNGSGKYAITQKSPTCWRSLLKEAHITNFCWHDLRHTYGSTMMRNGVDLNTLKELMGHASIKTTSIYLHTADDDKQKAANLLQSIYTDYEKKNSNRFE